MRAKILNASAGSGKTYQLAYQYVREVVDQPTIYRHILAVTFTNKATEEMKNRILQEIHALAEGKGAYLERLVLELSLTRQEIRRRAAEARSRILHDYSRFTVLTIDTFFQRILRAFIKELNLDLNYNIELETASILSAGADALIEEITTNQELLQWITRFVEERIEEGHRWDIHDGILSLGGELFKEANRENILRMRSREELQQIIERSTAAVAKSKQRLQQRAQEAVGIIASAGAEIDDFPYKKGGFVSWFYQLAAGNIYGYGARVAKAANDDAAWGKPKSRSQELRPTLQPILQELVMRYDSNQRHWNTTALMRETFRSFALLGDLAKQVQQQCDKQQLRFLSETKHLLAEFVARNDAPFIYEKVGNRYERFLIDEFQDTSMKEWENFLPLLQNALSQVEEHRNAVLLVGDIKQSIYRWRGSDWKILHRGAEEALGSHQTEVVALEENWRSLPMVVAFNNEAIAKIVALDNALLNLQLDDAVAEERLSQGVADELRNTLSNAYQHAAQRPRRKGAAEGYVTISTFEEQPPIVERICEVLDQGFSPSDIMILVRNATDGARIAAELLNFKNSNDDPRYRFDVMTRDALVIGTAPICQFIASAFRLSLNPEETLTRAQYNHFLGRPFDAQPDEEELLFITSLREYAPEEAFERLVLFHGLDLHHEETAYLQAMHEQIIAFCASRVADLALYLDWWEEQGSGKSISVEQRTTTIEITTIHRAKGLEKPVVMIPYCRWSLAPKASGETSSIVWAEATEGEAAALGRFPVRYKQQMANSAFAADYYRELIYSHVDHINLLYVAFTRAAEALHIFLPERRGNHVGDLLRQVLHCDGDAARIGNLEGRLRMTEEGERIEFGTIAPPEPAKKPREETETVLMKEYATSEADLRLRLPSQRYFEEEQEVELSPRNFGILMHRAFAEASDEAAIEQAVVQMQHDGTLSVEEADHLRRQIHEALSDPTVRSWFDGSWEVVRTEQEILSPRDRQIRRPDRVMTCGKRAVVVDYKFGETDPARYRRQIADYGRLLREMGYTEIEAWLWYVKLGKIEPIKIE